MPGETKLLHYTVVPTQPWKTDENPNGKIWEDAFVRACAAGYVDADSSTARSRQDTYARHYVPSCHPSTPPLRP